MTSGGNSVLDSDAQDLIKAMKATNSPIRDLYNSHGLDSVKDPIQNPNFAKAVIKLELYSLKLVFDTDSDWKTPSSLNETSLALSRHADQIKGSRTALIGYLACEAFKKPGIPATGGELVKISGAQTCQNTEPDAKTVANIRSGFRDLTAFVAQAK
jgi:hypothetical protein